MGNMETIKTIIDTDILIDLLRNKKEAIAFLAQLETENVTLCTTAINIFELHHGGRALLPVHRADIVERYCPCRRFCRKV